MLLAPLSDQQRQELAAEAREIVLAPGQVLFHQNDTGDSFFILRHGTVDVLVKQPDGSELKVAQITEGNFFGEMSALTGQPRSATIRAATAIACIEITRDNLHAIFKADAGILEQVSNIVAQRQADTQAKMKDATTSATPETKQAMQKTMLDRVKKFFGLFK
jgi:CRP-like cAMP-binding protein